MSANQGQESARIYQFPAGGRAALGGKRYDDFKPVTMQASPRIHEAACGSWYHEEAIREEEERRRDH